MGHAGILVRLLETLQLEDSQAEQLMAMLEAWTDTYGTNDGPGREYRVTPVGTEAAFEDWLESDLGVLKEFGYRVRLADVSADGIAGRQPRINSRNIPDLVCRFLEGNDFAAEGDWLVIENKATYVGQLAMHQLSRYVDLLPTKANVGSARVHGLLLADGISVNLRRGLLERGFGYLSLSVLGYRDALRRDTSVPRERDADETSVPYPTSRDLANDEPDVDA